MTRVGMGILAAALLLVGCEAGAQKPSATATAGAPATAGNNATASNLYDFTMQDIYEKDKPLSEFRGKVALVVNVASKCGFTPQYEGLEKLHEKYASRGFVVMGFPANDFGAQEPGTNSEIATYCTSKYGVKFQMFSKIVVKGEGKHPLYAFLTQGPPPGEVQWNFEKFLVDKNGKVIGRFPSDVTPESETLVNAIEKALGS
ncbi:MAG TPA: glutathione peroxidase [Polyangium sp.]|nr:glutathione peroxidase [Polyangium sp.]